MLARYLRTSQQRVRYAMHPDLAQALSNYLMIHSRAYNLPATHRTTMNSFGFHPHAQQMLEALAHGAMQGEHDAPGIYLDQLQESLPNLPQSAPFHTYPRARIGNYGNVLQHGLQPAFRGDDDIADLLDTLRTMHGHAQQLPGWLENYTHAALGSHGTRNFVRDALAGAVPGWEDEPASMHLWNALRHHPDESPPSHILSQAGILGSGGGYTPALLQVHDAMMNHPAMRGGHSQARADQSGGMQSIRMILRNHLMPHLQGGG